MPPLPPESPSSPAGLGLLPHLSAANSQLSASVSPVPPPPPAHTLASANAASLRTWKGQVFSSCIRTCVRRGLGIGFRGAVPPCGMKWEGQVSLLHQDLRQARFRYRV